MIIDTYTIAVTTTGTAGAATGTTTSGLIRGALLDLNVNMHASAPATTDVTIAYATAGGNIWARSDSAADVQVAPRITCVTNANAAITNSYDYFHINGGITVTLAQCDALTDAVVVTARVMRSD